MNVAKIRELIELLRQEIKKLSKDEYTVTRPTIKITNFTISNNGSTSYSTTIVDEPVIDTLRLSPLINDIKNTPQFRDVVAEIVKTYTLPKKQQNPQAQTEFWLGSFLNKIAIDDLEGKFDENKEVEMIMNLRNELEEGPLVHNSDMFLEGFHLETQEISLDEHVILRKPNSTDIEKQISGSFGLHRGFPTIPTVVAEISRKSKEQSEIYHENEKLLLILRLFRLGSVSAESQAIHRSSVIWFSGTGRSSNTYKHAINNNYTIKSSDTNDLIKFYNLMKNILPYDRQNISDRKFSSVRIALSRYSNSLLEPVEPERRVLTSLIGLEALFTQDGEKGETSYRLAIRIAKLLGFCGLKPMDIKNDMGKCYSIRNKVGHGLLLEEKERGDAIKYVDRLQNYLRESIILFILCLQEKSKGEIIDLIDKSMIDSETSVELEKWIKGKISVLPENIVVL